MQSKPIDISPKLSAYASWIPCSERMPEDKKLVMLSAHIATEEA